MEQEKGIGRALFREAQASHCGTLSLHCFGPNMAVYRIVKPIVAFQVKEKRAFTIPPGSLVETEDLLESLGFANVRWDRRAFWVPIPDLVERSQLDG